MGQRTPSHPKLVQEGEAPLAGLLEAWDPAATPSVQAQGRAAGNKPVLRSQVGAGERSLGGLQQAAWAGPWVAVE